MLLLFLFLIPLSFAASTSDCCEQIWSDWVDVGSLQPTDGNVICGMCYTQNQTRQCLSQSNGCECQGPSTQIVHTSEDLCVFPRETCCDGYSKKLDTNKKKYTCQPNIVPSSTAKPDACSTASSNSAPTKPTITASIAGTTTAPCVDSDTKNCAAWAANGFCTNPSYTDEQKKQYCAASCNLCDGCKDADTSCPAWKSNGFCENAGYTDDQKREYCAKSCNLCGETSTGAPTAIPCIDASTSCSMWATSTTKYPVMAWIHGGGLVVDCASSYSYQGATRNLVSRGVVIVVIQYRLGLPGFFTTNTADFPPNRGLLDQLEALKWIQKNIASFGGDPNSVTIFGESSGSSSVNAQLYSPLSRGYFHRAIMESGALYMHTDGPIAHSNYNEDLASELCNTSLTGNMDLLKSCMNALKPSEWLSIATEACPIIRDDYFLPKDS
ncbi:unnamed protein product, partial [Mesorhabditis belari]|uniref:Carboxylic ester hydrolase n=1 Tax=Mesorhabditis belari TaxID=2138241 RepID=A0AAF3EHM9_9BILA